VSGAASILARLIDTVNKGGFYLLNISPMADGTIPDDQQRVLRTVGAWLAANGEAIYGTRPWTTFQEGPYHFTARDGAVDAISSA
jgi:alpha-L-fucosidase